MPLPRELPPDRWRILADLPVQVAAAAAVADRQGEPGSTREIMAALSTVLAGAKLLRHNELVQAVFEAYKNEGQGEAAILELTQHPPDGLVPYALGLARSATALLDEAGAGEAGLEFRLWIRSIAGEIVASSGAGGFLGIGGRVVTDEEEAFIDRLSAALALDQRDEPAPAG